jgi:carbon-monoxide dehydrogenase large subunit
MTTPIFGKAIPRTEDPRFLTGQARYVDDVPVDGALRATFVRSMMAHARVKRVDVEAARAVPGVVDVFTGADLQLGPKPPAGNVEGPFSRPVLADEAVRYVGEPIALVVADRLGVAEDAAELVEVEYETLEPVVGAEAAVAEGAPLLFPEAGTNVAHAFTEGWDEDPLAGAEVVVRARIVHQRLAPVPMEGNAILVVPEEAGGLSVWVSTQIPFDVRSDLSDWFDLERDEIRVVAPDVGGGFGSKLHVYPEYLACTGAAIRLGRPVKWIETRSEGMVALNHGRAQIHDVEVGATRDGLLVGLRVDMLADMGAYPLGAYLPPTTLTMLTGSYRVPRVAARGRSVVTTTTPVGEYRGAGRPEATATIERAMDLLASELGVDPAELRRRNFVPPDAFPYTSAVGSTYDSGEYERALYEALRIAGYEDLRREQSERRARGDRLVLGIGISTYVEATGFGRKEWGSVEIDRDGTVTVRTGISPHGQGHETGFAQLVASVLKVPMNRVRILHSDSALVPRGEGTYGSRSLQIGGGAVLEAAEAVLDAARRLAAHLLEVGIDDVAVREDGRIGVTGAPDVALTWGELAEAALDPDRRPDGMTPGLSAETRRFQRELTYPFGAHVAVVEVDLETGSVQLARHVSVDDCGSILNPMLVEGQVHGGLAQGIAQALYEGVRFDERGMPLTGDLTSYAMPSAPDLPKFEIGGTVTPTPHNQIGVKGVGEAATIGSTPAVVNAAVDALGHLGIRHLDPPLTPERIMRALRGSPTTTT